MSQWFWEISIVTKSLIFLSKKCFQIKLYFVCVYIYSLHFFKQNCKYLFHKKCSVFIIHKFITFLYYYCSILPLIRPPILEWKSNLIRGVTSLEGNSIVICNYLSASEIWPDKRGGLWWEWSYKKGLLLWGIVVMYKLKQLSSYHLQERSWS